MTDKFLHHEALVKGNRVYSFAVSQNTARELRLKLTEQSEDEFGFEQREINIDGVHLADFIDKLIDSFVACKALLKQQQPAQVTAFVAPARVPVKSYSVDEKRQVHQQAYAPWTPADDDRLKELVANKKSVSAITVLLQRNEGAINSRIKKLALKWR